MSRDQDGAPVGAQYATILVIFELSKARWKIGILLPGSDKLSRYTVDGGDLAATLALLTKARRQIAIVALARKLMVALWRYYLEIGVVPSGAVLSPVRG